MQVKDLKSHPKNPRRMTAAKRELLRKSLTEYGDLSGFVYNRRTKRLLGGNQKKSVIPPEATIKIEHKYEAPTRVYTVAEGYIVIDGERFKYREVDAPEKWETEAMLAANKHSGDWDRDLLQMIVVDHPDLNLELSGFDHIELQALDISIPEVVFDAPEKDSSSEGTNKNTEVKTSSEGFNEEADKKYLQEEEKSTEQIDTEQITTSKNAFDSVDETTEVKDRKIIIIIGCPSEEVKQSLRDLLRPAVEQAGAKFF